MKTPGVKGINGVHMCGYCFQGLGGKSGVLVWKATTRLSALLRIQRIVRRRLIRTTFDGSTITEDQWRYWKSTIKGAPGWRGPIMRHFEHLGDPSFYQNWLTAEPPVQILTEKVEKKHKKKHKHKK